MTPAALSATLSCRAKTSSDAVLEAVGPDLRAVAGVDQLDRDADAAAGLADAALQHIAHAQNSADLLRRRRLALERQA